MKHMQPKRQKQPAHLVQPLMNAIMKLPLFCIAIALSLCVISCSGDDSGNAGLTELLDSILTYEQEHKNIEEKTGVQVLRAFDFYDDAPGHVNDKNAIDGGLLIADSRDSKDIPLPLGWEEVGNLLNEPILSSLVAHEEFPTWQLWLCCFVAVIGMSLIFTGSGGMLCLEKVLEIFSEKGQFGQESSLPSYFAAPVRTYSNVKAGLENLRSPKPRRPSLNLALS